MQLRFRLYDISVNVQQVDVILDVEFRQRFMMFVKVDTEFLRTNFTTNHRIFSGEQPPDNEANEQNLQIRKLPNPHHTNTDPPRLSYLAAVLLIILTVRSMLRRYSLYKKRPVVIEGVANG